MSLGSRHAYLKLLLMSILGKKNGGHFLITV